MAQSTENSKNGVGDRAAIARWDDDGRAPKSVPAIMSPENGKPLASWFVPPIVVPAFFVGLIIVSVVYQQFW
jgi:hypothetical protein